LQQVLARAAACVDDIYFCPHGPDDGCCCRKPKPGMLHAAGEKHGIDLHRSLMIGDSESDVQAGAAAGCRTVLVGDPSAGTSRADCVIRDLAEIQTVNLDTLFAD
jgi:histidinol-phosphate phosphatase family protein